MTRHGRANETVLETCKPENEFLCDAFAFYLRSREHCKREEDTVPIRNASKDPLKNIFFRAVPRFPLHRRFYAPLSRKFPRYLRPREKELFPDLFPRCEKIADSSKLDSSPTSRSEVSAVTRSISSERIEWSFPRRALAGCTGARKLCAGHRRRYVL